MSAWSRKFRVAGLENPERFKWTWPAFELAKMKFVPHPKSRFLGHQQAECLVTIALLAIAMGVALPIVRHFKEKGSFGTGLAVGVVGPLLGLWALIRLLNAIADFVERRNRFRCGERIQIVMGDREGTCGIVREVLHDGRLVRAELCGEGEAEVVELKSWEIQRIKQ